MKKEIKKYKAIIFDMDGTLINSLPYHILSFKDLLLERGIRVNDSFLLKHIGQSTKKILEVLKKEYGLKESVKELYEERRFHYFKFLGRKNIVFPKVLPTLEDLRLDYKLAVATGSSETTFIHSTPKDLQELFDTVITINDVKRGKPFPEQLILASRKLRVKPSECLCIGDSIYDGLAAKRAGMDFVGVATGEHTLKELKQAGALTVLNRVSGIKEFLK